MGETEVDLRWCATARSYGVPSVGEGAAVFVSEEDMMLGFCAEEPR